MRRIFLALVLLLLAALALPPLWFRLFREPVPELPPPGRRVVLASGAGVNVVEQGAGAPVVLVHGLPGTAYSWRLTSAALAARGVRALAYDRIGYGWSDPRTNGAFTIASNAQELLELLAAEGLGDVTVVGWSYGGATAIAAAQRDRSRIARLVLVGSAGPGMEESGPPPALAWLFSDPVLAWLHAVPPLARGIRVGISRVAFSDGPQPDWWLPEVNANFARPGMPQAWRNEGAAFASVPIPDPTGLPLPILVVHGDDDRLAPIAIGRELARRAPSAELIEVPGASHMLPVTHAELLAGEIVARARPPTAR
jgi:pimeloyl-ACP methyl ester carboxylesterase